MISIYTGFIRTTTIFRQRAGLIFAGQAEYSEWQYKYLSMALLSQVWLKWSSFCRDVIISSCAGTTRRSGALVTSRGMENSWQRIAYEINKRNQTTRPIGNRIHFKRHEPTWGDVVVLLQALPILSPSNVNELITGFGMPFNGPKHIQCVRNSCYHTNDETVNAVRNIMHYYTGTRMQHPIDLIWWNDNTGVNAIYSWLDELEEISDIVTR